MSHLTRRSFALAAIAAPALSGMVLPALAAGHSSAAGAPALFDASLGRYRITAIFDGMVPLSKSLFSGPSQEEIDAALAASGIKGDALPAPVTAYLLQSETRNILIDAGFGEIDAFGPGFGRVTSGLAAIGVEPSQVDTVVLTHAHPDHLGGLLSGGGATFDNAELYVTEVEHGFWSDPAMAAGAPEGAQGMFAAAVAVFGAYGDRLNIVSAGAEVAPGVRMELSPGHTPGHGVVHIDGGDRQLLMVADSFHSVALHFPLPEIAFGFDTDTAMAAQSRLKIFDRAAADGLLIAATHAPFPGFGRIVNDASGYRYVPASWT